MGEGAATGRIVIVGAGPCGLACARELSRLGHDDWLLLERDETAGGHASSVVDPAGFTWDIGGHVVFSHYGEFDALLEETLGDDVEEHERSSYVLVGDRWVPYPFQNNLRYLEPEVARRCAQEFVDAPGGQSDLDFEAWIVATFGRAIAETFMLPYNRKVWATPLAEMSAGWIAERVSVPDPARALRNLEEGRDDLGWGPNSTFRFPRRGGTGEIYRRLAEQLGSKIQYGREVVAVDAGAREIETADGRREPYGALVTTAPLDRVVASLRPCPDELRAAARELRHNGIKMVGVGVGQPLADDRSWLYFPGEVPFYRVTNFAKYAAANVPGSDTSSFSAFLTETAYAPGEAPPDAELEERVLGGLVAVGLVDPEAPVVSVHTVDAPYAYPVPTRGRDRALAVIQPWLDEHGIHARGRFGSWRYEIGNMDHAVKMGIDVARRLVEGRPEELWSA